MELLKEQVWVKSVGEVGFNGGHSSYAFLSARPDIEVISFDLGSHAYVKAAKRFIDQRFPGRHTLILGDSLQTVPAFTRKYPQQRFDMLFVDGGHTYAVASADLENLRSLGHESTIIVIDDLTPWNPWGQGPTQAWSEAQDKGLVRQTDLVRDGTQVSRIEGSGNDKIWATGNYVFDGNTQVT
ncbi:MAG: class I SAM-dependent methyltransferase [bacterium]|nr:class I SAM-dependent methyltransferase [bacterium]